MNSKRILRTYGLLIITLFAVAAVTGCRGGGGPGGGSAGLGPRAPTSGGGGILGGRTGGTGGILGGSGTGGLPGAPTTTSTTLTAGTTEGGIDLGSGDSGTATSGVDKLDVWFFCGAGCGPCNQMKNGPWPEAQSEFSGKVNFHVVDVGEDPDLAAQMGYTGGSIPSFVFYKNGQQVPDLAFTGYSDYNLRNALDQLVGASNVGKAQAQASADTGSDSSAETSTADVTTKEAASEPLPSPESETYAAADEPASGDNTSGGSFASNPPAGWVCDGEVCRRVD